MVRIVGFLSFFPAKCCIIFDVWNMFFICADQCRLSHGQHATRIRGGGHLYIPRLLQEKLEDSALGFYVHHMKCRWVGEEDPCADAARTTIAQVRHFWQHQLSAQFASMSMAESTMAMSTASFQHSVIVKLEVYMYWLQMKREPRDEDEPGAVAVAAEMY